MWEREREHHGVGEIAPLNYAFNDRAGEDGIYWWVTLNVIGDFEKFPII